MANLQSKQNRLCLDVLLPIYRGASAGSCESAECNDRISARLELPPTSITPIHMNVLLYMLHMYYSRRILILPSRVNFTDYLLCNDIQRGQRFLNFYPIDFRVSTNRCIIYLNHVCICIQVGSCSFFSRLSRSNEAIRYCYCRIYLVYIVSSSLDVCRRLWWYKLVAEARDSDHLLFVASCLSMSGTWSRRPTWFTSVRASALINSCFLSREEEVGSFLLFFPF